MKSWYTIRARGTGAEVLIYDEIGAYGVSRASPTCGRDLVDRHIGLSSRPLRWLHDHCRGNGRCRLARRAR